ncbi:MAG: endo-1,4-beta-xylanase [Lachnospiraceae bacterium]|nr:endo-1,4-beta-xylanase [Lachnospiraceae bacterium]
MKKKKRLGALCLIAAMIISLCGQGEITSAAKKKPALSKKKLTLKVGQSKKLSVKNAGKKVKKKWKSKNKKIATVSKKGKVKAKKAGKTYVTCKFKYKGKKYTKKCKVTVKKKNPVVTKAPTKTTNPGTLKPNQTTPPARTNSPSDTTPPPGGTNPPSGTTPPPGGTNPPSSTTTPSGGTEVPAPTKVPGTPIPSTDDEKALFLDFEDGKNHYVTGRQGEEVLTVEAGGYDDAYCLKVSNRKKNWAGPQINVTHNVQDFTTYKVEAYVKHTAGGNRTINCTWQSTDFADNVAYTTIKTLSVPTGNWAKLEATVVAPGDVKELYLYFEMQDYQNDFYVDNISLTEKHLDMEQVLAVDSLKTAYSGRFPVGCAVYSYNLKNPEISEFIKHHYNTVTFADELKPESLLNEEKSKAAEDGMPVINTDIIDKCLSLAKANGLKVRFHTLVWHSQTPDWYFCENYTPEYDGSGTAKTNITNLVDKKTMLKRIESYITQIMTYTETKYPGTVYAYDVVNEVISKGSSITLRPAKESLYGAIFTDDAGTADTNEGTLYITEAFRYARAAQRASGSSAKLFYNDYIGLNSSGERKAVVEYLKDAKAAGNIDGLGMQSHQTNLGVTDGDNIKNSINYFKDAGYEVQITELDFASKDNSESGNQTLATAYSKFMQIILDRMDKDSVQITNVTFWNLTDLDTWLNDYYNDRNTYYPSLFDENYMPKAAFYALINLVKGESPAPTQAPSPTPGAATPTPGGSTNPTPTPSNPVVTPNPDGTTSLNLESGNITISATGYTVGGSGEQAGNGAYNITGTANNTISVTGGTHTIILDSVTTTPTGASPITLSGNANVTLILTGTSKLTGPKNFAAIEVPAGCELTVAGTGTVFATGGDSSAAIGVTATEKVAGTLGKIIIRSGTMICMGGSNGAGIGDGQVGKGGGEIEIYGGNIYAQSSRNGAGIGGGGSASNPEKLTVKIYGGIITAGGSNYEIGDGKSQTHCEVSVYGGAFKAGNGKTLFGTTVTTADEYDKEEIDVSSFSGIKSVTIDGKDQGISSFYITDNKGTVGTPSSKNKLSLYMTKADSHVVVITDTDGVEHTTNITR